MTAEGKRSEVAAMYPGEGWKKKVKKMTDAQVFAIWKRDQEKKERLRREQKENSKGDPGDSGIPF